MLYAITISHIKEYRTNLICRRLCPDISFFQQGTDYPREEIVNASGQKRLHHRVQHTVLRSANVERKGLGVTKVITFNSNVRKKWY